MDAKNLYWKWYEKLKENSEESRKARRKWHETKDKDDEMYYMALCRERQVILSFLGDLSPSVIFEY